MCFEIVRREEGREQGGSGSSLEVNIQDRVANEQEEESNGEQRETTQVDNTSSGEDVAISLFLLIGVRVMQIVVCFDILGEQQQPG